MRRSLIPVIPVCTSPTSAFHQHSTWQCPCSYLGVKKQRGGSQVLLLEGTHGVCHLPLLHPAGQQHRGLHTSQGAPHCASVTHKVILLFSSTPFSWTLQILMHNCPAERVGNNMNTNPLLWAVFFLAFRLMTKKTFCSCSAAVVYKPLLV